MQRVTDYLDRGLRRSRDDDRRVRQLREHLELLQNQGYWPGFESLARLTASEPVLLFEHARDLLLVVDEPEQTDHELVRAAHDLTVAYEQSPERILPPPSELYADAAAIRKQLARPDLSLQELVGAAPEGATATLTVPSRSARAYAGRVADLIEDLRQAEERGGRTVFVMRGKGSAERLVEILREYDLEPPPIVDGRPPTVTGPGGLFVGVGALRAGFELHEQGLAVLTERGVFGQERKAPDRKSASRAVFVSDFRDLKQGHPVVHVDHGIAHYRGLGRPKGGSLNRDFMVLEFAAGDKLFGPVDRLDLVQKYNGAGGKKPPGRARLGAGQGPGPQVRSVDGQRAAGALRASPGRHRIRVRRGHAVAARAGGRVPVRSDHRSGARPAGDQARHAIGAHHGSAAGR